MKIFKHLISLEEEATNFGFRWSHALQIVEQIASECVEIEENFKHHGTKTHLQEEIGDLIHAAFSLCFFCGFDPKQTLSLSLDKFAGRLAAVKKLANAQGYSSLNGQSFETLMAFWEKAKDLQSTPK